MRHLINDNPHAHQMLAGDRGSPDNLDRFEILLAAFVAAIISCTAPGKIDFNLLVLAKMSFLRAVPVVNRIETNPPPG